MHVYLRSFGKKEKYQEMYAADVMSMSELKEKIAHINKEIDIINEQLELSRISDDIEKSSLEQIRKYTEEIEKFLALENATNMDLRKIISHIVVNKSGEVKIHLRDLSNLIAT